jgi:hypothetical protein
MRGQLCTVGDGMERLFYFAANPILLIEILKKRHGIEKKYLVRLVDAEGNPVQLPQGCRFEYVDAGERTDLLDIYLRSHERCVSKTA